MSSPSLSTPTSLPFRRTTSLRTRSTIVCTPIVKLAQLVLDNAPAPCLRTSCVQQDSSAARDCFHIMRLLVTDDALLQSPSLLNTSHT